MDNEKKTSESLCQQHRVAQLWGLISTMIVHQMDAKIDSMIRFLCTQIDWLHQRRFVAFELDGPRRRLQVLRRFPAWRSRRCDPHPLNLFLQLLMHVLDEIVLFRLLSRLHRLRISVDDQVVVVVVFICVVVVIGCERIEIGVWWWRRLRGEIFLFLQHRPEFLDGLV